LRPILERTDINTIFLWDYRIDEPIVTITDLVVSLLCFWFAYRLHTSGNKSRGTWYFKLYFLLMGVATLFGGVFGHAFLYALSWEWKLPGWIVSMFSIMMIERGAIEHTRLVFKPQIIKVLSIVNILELLTFMSLTFYFMDFFFVEFHSGYGLMFVVLGLESFLYFKTKNAASKNILIGIGIAAVAALFFMNQWIIHPWFNHISASHTLMAVAAFFFYEGAKRVSQASGKDQAL